MLQEIKMINYFPVKEGIYYTISPSIIMTGGSLNLKNVSVYIFYSTVKYTSKKILAIAIKHVPKIQYPWNQAEIYKAGSSL